MAEINNKNLIKIPKENEKLAELIGIIIGDGYLHKSSNKIRIDGNASEEKGYYIERICVLIKDLFNYTCRLKFYPDKNGCYVEIGSKAIFHFLNKDIGIERGKKDHIKIPEKILKDTSNLKACLRGLFDTDGELKFYRKNKQLPYYPQLRLVTSSRELKNQVVKSLIKLDLYPSVYINKDRNYEFNICGKDKLYRWMNMIGSKNPRTYTKYEIWTKFGFLPSKTKLSDRVKILKGEIDIKSYFAPVLL